MYCIIVLNYHVLTDHQLVWLFVIMLVPVIVLASLLVAISVCLYWKKHSANTGATIVSAV